MKRAVAAVVLLLLSWTASAADSDMPPTIQDVKARHAPRLLAMPGVMSVGIGRGGEGHEVIVIGLDHARPQTQSKLPLQLEGYGVRVEIIGTVRAQ